MGVRTRAPLKPKILAAVEMVERFGLPLVAGGLMDQPHIWLLQMDLVNGVRDLFKAVNDLASK